MKVAFYGRYSSDNQRDASIEDQHRVVRRWAETHGHQLVAEFSDAAISGANIRVLSGLQEALRSALTAPAPFDAIAVDQLSRLSRDVGDTHGIIKRLRFGGVRVIAVADGIDTEDDTAKVSVTVKSLVNELYLDDLRKTTKRGLDGRFLKGYATGGRTYGYRSEPVCEPGRTDSHGQPIPIGYRITLDPIEANVVRRIFKLFRDGLGEKAIAKQLNLNNTGRPWRPNTIYLMLQNSKYVGQFYFNRREWRKNPETGRRVYRWRPPDQWESRVIEALRIIDDKTWEVVQRRLKTRQHLFSRQRSATAHLLSGLLICDRCGGRLSIVAKDYYGCRNHIESGTCLNDLRIRREAVEELVIRELALRLPEYIESLRVAANRRSSGKLEPSRRVTRGQLAQLRRQAQGIMGAIQQGRLQGRALEEALGTYQRIWGQVEQLEQAQAATPQSTPIEIQYDRAVVEDFVARLPEALRADVRLGREFLRETLRHVRIADAGHRLRTCPICAQVLGKTTPQHLALHGVALRDGGYRRFPELGFTKGARLTIQPSPEGLLNTGKVFGLVVAGVGFEPTTFGF